MGKRSRSSRVHFEIQVQGEGQKKRVYQNISDLIEAIKPFGTYQIYACFVLQYAGIVGTGIYALLTFGSLVPQYTCAEDDFQEGVRGSSDHCAVLYNCTNRTKVSGFFKSMADEWMLVCDDYGYSDYPLLAVTAGRVIGTIFGGHVGDYFGRLKALYPSIYALCIISTLSVASRGWKAFTIFFGLIGFFLGLYEVTSLTLIAEKTNNKHRWYVVASSQWCIQWALVSLIAYLTEDWRLYIIIVNFILAPLLVFYLIFLESPRYLVYTEQFDKAAEALSDIASDRWNQRDIHFEPEHLETINGTRGSDPPDPKYPSPWQLINSWKRAGITLTLLVGVAVQGCGFRFLIQGINPTANDHPFLNVTFSGLARLWVPFAIILLDRKFKGFGRRTCYLFFFGFILLMHVIIAWLYLGGKVTGGIPLLILSVFGASLTGSGAEMSVTVFLLEVYPTAIRGMAYGWNAIGEGLGSLMASYMITHPNTLFWSVPLFFILPPAIAFLLGYFLLPETKNKLLPDRLDGFVCQ